jgi:hypothetical protein
MGNTAGGGLAYDISSTVTPYVNNNFWQLSEGVKHVRKQSCLFLHENEL